MPASSTPPPPPASISVPGGAKYVLRRGWTAIHGASAPSDRAPVLELENEHGKVRVYDRSVRAPGGSFAGPVYSTTGGMTAVPTGVLFVRFADAAAIAARRTEIEAAGFVIDSIPPWAPSSAWVRASVGGISAALRGMDRLRRMGGVEHVEPEMLLRRGFR